MKFPLATLAMFLGAASAVAADPPVSFAKDVRPIFHQHCLGCHQPAKAMGGFVMTEFAALFKPGEAGKPGVVAGKPEASFLLDEIREKNGKHEMPKGRDALSPKQYALVEAWIKEGAKDDTPPAAKEVAIDAEHPPIYAAPPVVTSLAYSADGKILAATGYHEILLHKADGSGLLGRLVGVSERVQSLAFSPDGKWLAASAGSPGRFGEVQVWDIAKQRLKVSAPATFDTVYGVSWSPDGKTLAFGCGDNTVRAIDAVSGKQVLFMGTHSDWVLGTAFSRDGLHLVSVGRDMTMKLTEVPTQRFIDNVTSITPGALKGGIMAVDIRPVTTRKTTKVPDDSGGGQDKSYDELLVAGSDGKPRLYKMHRETKRVIGDDANRIREYEAMPGRVSAAKFDKPGTRLAAASSLDGKGEVRVYDVETGKRLATAEKVVGPMYAVAWAPDGKTLASAGFDGRIHLHDPATGKLLREFSVAPTGTVSK